MAILRSEEIRELNPEEMEDKIAELRTQLLRERSMVASGGAPENPGKIREIRRTIARILTIKKLQASSKKEEKKEEEKPEEKPKTKKVRTKKKER